MLVRVGAPPILLEMGSVFTVGRSQERDLTVPSSRVSRRHAEIIWEEEQAILRDMGSQNGTLVNGRRVTRHVLADGDEVEFGPFLCTFRYSAAEGTAAGPDANALTKPMMADAMAGRLDQIQMTELLQTLEFNKKSGTLEVFGSSGEGRVLLRDGKPFFAEVSAGGDEDSGEAAIYRLIAFTSGQFVLSPELEDLEANVSMNMGSILMEAARRLDESGEV